MEAGFLVPLSLGLAIGVAAILIWSSVRTPRGTGAAVADIGSLIRDEGTRNRDENEARGRALREELRDGLDLNRKALDQQMTAAFSAQGSAAEALRGEVNTVIKGFGDSLKRDVDGLARSLKDRFDVFSEALSNRQSSFEKIINERLTASADNLATLTKASTDAHAELKSAVEQRLETLRADNEAKLEQMRLTVDEKLQTTLDQRIGESFKHVSERLEHVHRGLGEMQTLAAGVGDLKKIMSNVKDRGGWAEGQLGEILDQQLACDQYVKNALVDLNSNESVEYAVKFPGPTESGEVLLPIDAKFPKEDYERLVEAWSAGDGETARNAIAALKKVLETEAKKICEKYIRPPRTTDFAIMFLPTEGLYAEAMRIPGFAADLQARFRVTVAGPTTLWAILTAFRTGFRTLAIQRHSSDVWQVLGAVKGEFEKHAKVWDKLGKQLRTAQNTVEKVGVRTRALSRTLRDVERVEPPLSDSLLLPALSEVPLEAGVNVDHQLDAAE